MDRGGIILVAGMGEVGRPIHEILSEKFDCVGVDIQPVEVDEPCTVLHICYPFQVSDFVGTTAVYINRYEPALTIIHSTVAPGTTRKVQEAVGDRLVAYSPVRGKHARMKADMLHYKKFVAAPYPEALEPALAHLTEAGFQTGTFRTVELAELSKLVETTYFGVLIAWAQEMERWAEDYQGAFDDVNAFIEEIEFLPSHIFPGEIGGHCVMPNIAILQTQLQSRFLDAVLESNQLKREQLLAATAR